MPWEKQFDQDVALDRALDTFWAHGYSATSVQDLLDAMEINRGSMYDTFGGKRRLFLDALKRYDKVYRKEALAELARDRSPREAIIAAFRTAADAVLVEGSRDGCFVMNTAMELAPHDTEIGNAIRNSLRSIELFFEERLEAGIECGEFPPDLDASRTAALLLALLAGTRLLTRGRPEPRLLNGLVERVERLLHP